MVYVLDAHICLNNPPQRGGVPINALSTVGLTLCGNTVGPCGVQFTNASATQKNYTAGTTINVQVILNLQHRTATNPGNISISYCSGTCQVETDFTSIPGASIPDPGNVSIPSTLTIPTTLPTSLPNGPIVFRAVYQTNEQITYYICSDVSISGGTNGTSFLNTKLGGKVPVLYVIIAGGALVLIVIIIIIIVVIKKKRGGGGGGGDYRGGGDNDRREPQNPIPMMSMNDIQSNLMKTADDQSDGGGNNGGYGGGNNGGYGGGNNGGYGGGNNGGYGGGNNGGYSSGRSGGGYNRY